jgi:putative YphP/YqiW family bacilliredoxin
MAVFWPDPGFWYIQGVPYPEQFIAPMRADLTRFGVEEARTPADVDRFLAPGSGTVMMVINSVCGCAAGRARPAVGMALKHSARPSKAATVFAGGDEAAVAHVRKILSAYPPSSPSIALFQDGKPVYMLHRGDIERRDPEQIAKLLTEAFDRYCAVGASAPNQAA